MAQHMVTFLIGVLVDAEDEVSALRKAAVPFNHGAIPNLCGIVSTGARLATEDDANGGIQKRINELSRDTMP